MRKKIEFSAAIFTLVRNGEKVYKFGNRIVLNENGYLHDTSCDQEIPLNDEIMDGWEIETSKEMSVFPYAQRVSNLEEMEQLIKSENGDKFKGFIYHVTECVLLSPCLIKFADTGETCAPHTFIIEEK
jgi:hypothetical protein